VLVILKREYPLKKSLTHLTLDAANLGKHTALDAVVTAYRQQTQV
jgi:hypothetical protein